MNCPYCVGVLEKKYLEGIKAFICPLCCGIWIKKHNLDKLLKLDSSKITKDDLDKEDFFVDLDIRDHSPEPKEKFCPTCSQKIPLKQKRYRGKKTIKVEFCSKCYGIWLDSSKIQRMRHRGLRKSYKFFRDTVFVIFFVIVVVVIVKYYIKMAKELKEETAARKEEIRQLYEAGYEDKSKNV